MAIQDGKGLFDSTTEIPPGDQSIDIPDTHYAALGKVADAWADLEFEIDQLIWHLMHTNQALGACATAQMIGPAPRLRTVRALAHLWELSEKILGDIGSFEGQANALAQERNRALHDKRLINWKTKQVVRFEVTTRKTLTFEQRPESLEYLAELREKILKLVREFTAIKQRAVTELLSSPEKQRSPLPYIIQGNTPI